MDYQNRQLRRCNFHRPPLSLHTTMVTRQSPQRIVGGDVFQRHNGQPIRRN